MTPDPRFPPAPWHLTGDMVVSLWRVPADDLPHWRLPAGTRPWIMRRRCTLATFWVDYRSGGVLAYREFLVALVVRDGRRPAASAVAAWVDDDRALAGGRALWGIPKDKGTFTLREDRDRTRAALLPAEGPAVRADHRDLLRLPFRLPARAHLVQRLPDGTTCRVPLRIAGRPALGRTRLDVGPSSPLSFFRRRTPLFSLAVRDFRSVIGEAAPAA